MATPTRSPSSASPPAAGRSAPTWPPPARRGCSTRPSSRAVAGCGAFLPAEEAYEDGDAVPGDGRVRRRGLPPGAPDSELIAAADTLADADDEADEVDFTFVGDGVNLSESALERAEQGRTGRHSRADRIQRRRVDPVHAQLDEPDDAELVELVADVTDDPDALLALYPARRLRLEPRALPGPCSPTCATTARPSSFAATAPGAYVYHYTYVRSACKPSTAPSWLRCSTTPRASTSRSSPPGGGPALRPDAGRLDHRSPPPETPATSSTPMPAARP